MSTPHPICVQLRRERTRRGLSLEDVAKSTGIPSVVIGSWERGDRLMRIGSPTLTVLLDFYWLILTLTGTGVDPDPIGTALKELARRHEQQIPLRDTDLDLLREAIGGTP